VEPGRLELLLVERIVFEGMLHGPAQAVQLEVPERREGHGFAAGTEHGRAFLRIHQLKFK
jgi:hypothetical protein